MSDELIELPDAWLSVALKQITQKIVDGSHNPPTKQDSGFPMLSARNIENGKINFSDYRLIEEKAFEIEDKRTKVRGGDVLLTIVGAIGRTAIVPNDINLFTLQRSVAVLSPLGITSEFLMYQLQSPAIQKILLKEAKGTAQKGIYLKALGVIPILLPPLNEQKRIVAKIEELNDRTQKAKEALDSIPQLCDRFRQSVLAAAFRGDLTADWREQNPDVEPASVLLERTAEKLKQDFHLTNKEINKDKGFLPDSWAWTRFKLFVKGIQAGKNFSCPEIPVTKDTVGIVKISAVTWGKFDPTETKTVIDSSKIDSNLFIKNGDFLISRANTIELVGASVVVDEINYSIMLSDKVWRVDFIDINKRFINFYLKSVYGRREIESRATGNQLSMRNISQNAFKEIIVALPPLEEQQEIANQIEALFKIIDNIQQQYQNSETYLAKLNQSILAKAFRGELVPQDPDDEPASVLLERIRAERDKLNNSKPKSKRTSKPKSKTSQGQVSIPGLE